MARENDSTARSARWLRRERASVPTLVAASRAGPVVGGTLGIVAALAGASEVASLPGAHQLAFVLATCASWAAVGLVAAGLGHLVTLALAPLGVRRTWGGWFALAAYVGIEVGFGACGLDTAIELLPLACLALGTVVVLDRLGRVASFLERTWGWAAAGIALHIASTVLVSRSAAASHGVVEIALWVGGCGPAAVLLLPLALGARSNSIVAVLLVAFCGVFARTLVPAPARAGVLFTRVPDGAALRGERPLNVLFVTVDTLRADAVGCYGGAPAVTPNIDRLASEGVLFETVQSPVPMTYPAHTSLFTGLDPGNHGVVNNMPWAIRADVETVPEVLARSMRYSTAAFVSGFTLKRDASRLFQRFELYDDTFSPLRVVPDAWVDSDLVTAARSFGEELGYKLRRLRYGGDRPADRTVDSAIEWLESGGHEPFFLWVHLFDPHLPYEPPPEHAHRHDPDYDGGIDGFWYRVPPKRKRAIVETSPRDVEHLRSLYRAEVTFADEQVGRLLDSLARAGLADDTLVVLTSDHGESLGEHEYWFDHSYFLYQTCLAVPLVVRLPAAHRGSLPPGSRVEAPVRLIDLAPTIVELTGVQAWWPTGDGRSLAPVFDGGAVPEASARAYSVTYDLRADNERYLLAVRDGNWKYVRTAARWDDLLLVPRTEQLYDLATDPGELRDLAGSNVEDLARLRALADARFEDWAAGDPAAAGALSADDRERLRDIGYL
jgi:arylsulfatase A-like enzyme